MNSMLKWLLICLAVLNVGFVWLGVCWKILKGI